MSTEKSSLATFTVDMTNVLINIEERGDGSDSDLEEELFEELDEATCAATVDKRVYLEEEEVVSFSDRNVHIVSEEESGKNSRDLSKSTTSIPTNWKPDERKVDK